MRRVLLALAALAAPVLVAGGAAAAPEPKLRTDAAWMRCTPDGPVQNVALALGRTPTWGPGRPTGPATAGCGYYENAGGAYLGPNRTTLDAEWEGTFTGNLDSLAVEMYAAHVSAARANGTLLARVTLFVDGKEYFNGPETGDLRLPVPAMGTAVADRVTFTLTGIGLATEDGEGTTTRRYRLVLRSLSEEQTGWLFGSADTPAGLVMNPAAPVGVRVPVQR